MRKTILTTILLLAFGYSINAQNDSIPQSIEQQEKAIKLATTWVNLITEGVAIDSLINISTLPFALDRSVILNSTDELKSFYIKIFENVGKGNVPKVISEIHSSKYEMIEDIIPLNVLIVKVTVLEGNLKDDSIFLSINISGNKMKIMGFSD